jgi:uncharacterized membrane protein
MDRGLATDIATGRPLFEEKQDKAEESQKAEERQLQARATFAMALQTDAGKQLMEVIRKRLMSRIQALVTHDPEAKALVDVMTDLGIKAAVAEEAMEELFRRYVRK